jgi:hypothetical protein
MIRSRRFALAAAVVILGLTACGDPGSTQPLANQPKVIQLANGSARALSASAPAAASADSKTAFFGTTEFVFDGALPALDQPGPSWFFAPGQQPDQQRIAQLAKALGVNGEVRQVPADQGGGWAVGPTDFSGPVLTVGNDAMLSWWLSAGPGTVSGVACAEPGIAIDPNNGDGAGLPVTPVDVSAPGVVDVAVEPPSGGAAVDVAPPNEPTTTLVPSCVAPTPPVGVPNPDEAVAKAKELMTAWGDNPGSYSFDDVSADVWSASVNARLVLDGAKSPVTVTVGFGGEGAVSWASGSLAVPQRGADYPTVGAATGLKRLNDQQGFGGGPAILESRTGAGVEPAVGAPVAGAPAIAPCEPGPAVDCAPIPIPTEPITVTLNKVEADMTTVWAADGTVWLLPAYTFHSADGGLWSVNAVEDAYLQQPVVLIPDTVPAVPAVPGLEVPVPQPAPGPEATILNATP